MQQTAWLRRGLCPHRRVRVWRFASGKLRRSYDESAEAAAELQRHGGEALRLEPIDFGRRLAVEKELVADEEVCHSPQPSHLVVYVIILHTIC